MRVIAHGAGALAPFAIGSALMMTIFAGGHISGGAFNPAVAVGISVMGLSSWANLWIYLVADFAGAAVAAGAFKGLDPAKREDTYRPESVDQKQKRTPAA